MKVLGIIGVVVSIIALGLGAYLQFSVAPAANEADIKYERMAALHGEAYYTSAEGRADQETARQNIPAGEMVLLAGGLAFILSIVPAIKKQKVAWIGVIFGLGALLLGAAHGTHMFS
ncbi:MAG: hypothetical protein HRT57_08535 [Crocinitomicaceae bacterium]|nr:hypothetical protein [Crocinitomicaceae bacterium]